MTEKMIRETETSYIIRSERKSFKHGGLWEKTAFFGCWLLLIFFFLVSVSASTQKSTLDTQCCRMFDGGNNILENLLFTYFPRLFSPFLSFFLKLLSIKNPSRL